jgi:hypothetical protein
VPGDETLAAALEAQIDRWREAAGIYAPTGGFPVVMKTPPA